MPTIHKTLKLIQASRLGEEDRLPRDRLGDVTHLEAVRRWRSTAASDLSGRASAHGVEAEARSSQDAHGQDDDPPPIGHAAADATIETPSGATS